MKNKVDLVSPTQASADMIAARFMAWAAPVRFRVAQSAVERKAAFQLRYEVVTQQGWARPEDFLDGLEQDAHDPQGVHLLGWDGDKVVATTRLIFPEPGRLLPTEREFELRVAPLGRVVDGGRAIVARTYSDHQHRVFAGLLGYSWFQIKQRGFYYLCGAAIPAMIRLCRSMGYQITLLGPARHYWGEARYPIRFDVLESTPALLERWSHLIQEPNYDLIHD